MLKKLIVESFKKEKYNLLLLMIKKDTIPVSENDKKTIFKHIFHLSRLTLVYS